MSCGDRPHFHFARVAWRQADVPQHDLQPAADVALVRNHRTPHRKERQFTLAVVSQSGVEEGLFLGSLAIRCERHYTIGHEWVWPATLAIVDGTVQIDDEDDGA